MSYSIELHPETFKELQATYNWYEERSEGLGDRFMALVNKRLNEIAANPDRYAKHKGNYRETKSEHLSMCHCLRSAKEETNYFCLLHLSH